MSFLDIFRKTPAIVTAGVAVAATGWMLYEEYQKPSGLFSPPPANAEAGCPKLAKQARKQSSKNGPSPAAPTFVNRKLIEAKAYESFARAKQARFEGDHAVDPTDDGHNHQYERNEAPGPTHAVGDKEAAEEAEEKEEKQEDEEDEEDDEDDEDEDDLKQFRPVMAELDLEKLQQAAIMVRLHLLQTRRGCQLGLKDLLNLSCKISRVPLAGSYNLAYAIKFSDGVSWIARIPGHGTSRRFGALDAKKMNCEYWTMRHIAANTSIPIPEIFHWHTSCEQIGTPYALMSKVEGRALCEVWGNGVSEQQRLDLLSNIAGHLSQLHKLSFECGGMLNFDDEGRIEKVGGEIVLEAGKFVNWHTTKECSPYSTLVEALHQMLDAAENEEMDARDRSELRLLHLALESIPDYLGKERRFALSPPDLNYQNILVDTQYQITGFIDWDGVHAESSSAGFARYPLWITSDWDPASYEYSPESQVEHTEDSPETLARYRQHYATEFAKAAKDFDGYDPRMTTLSHMVDALCLALVVEFCRAPILHKLLEHAFHGKPPFELSDYADDHEAGDTSGKDTMVKDVFATMWYTDWERQGCGLSDNDSGITIVTTDNGSDGSSNLSTDDEQEFEKSHEPLAGHPDSNL